MSSSSHVLVVDDDREIRTLVGAYLRDHGFRVSLAADGRQMREVLAGARIDLIVLDLMLPGEDGLSLCRDLRARSNIPVLMLTARGDTIDRVIGLEMGADDYLGKPFEPRELLARIRSVLRRFHALPDHADATAVRRYRFAGRVLETESRQLTDADGVAVPLSGAEYRLLLVFLQHSQRVLSRDQLMDLTKGREAQALDRSIDLQVSRLRSKLGDDGRTPSLIRTQRSEGYVFTASVEREA